MKICILAKTVRFDMEHVLFFDGNQKKIGWVIQTNNNIVEQQRDHHELYLDKVSNKQSKYIALHVGLFWGIGTFRIKNEDLIEIRINSKSMFKHLSENLDEEDEFIQKRAWFIKKLIEQRKLNIKYIQNDAQKNLATKLIS